MSNKEIPMIMQGNNLILVIDNVPHTICEESHFNYHKIIDAIKNENWDLIAGLIDVSESITNYAQGKLEIRDGVIFWNGREFHNALSDRILKMYDQGFAVDSMINFMENLMKNPSYSSVEQLYGFLEHNELPITSDGCFMAYKKVNKLTEDDSELGFVAGDFVDGRTGKMRNNVGDVVAEERNTVDDNPNNTCSRGLHFASMDFVRDWAGSNTPIILLKINPRDVVSIPTDYKNQKGRCCEYTVVGVHSAGNGNEAFDTPVVDEYTFAPPVRDEKFAGNTIPDEDNKPGFADTVRSLFRRPDGS